jgi:hypothetical protein
LEVLKMASKPGLYAAIHAKRARIAAGSGEKMRKPGTKGAPTAAAFKKSAKTAQRSLSGYGGLPAMKRIKPMKKGK